MPRRVAGVVGKALSTGEYTTVVVICAGPEAPPFMASWHHGARWHFGGASIAGEDDSNGAVITYLSEVRP